jgi:hypothetical protein
VVGQLEVHRRSPRGPHARRAAVPASQSATTDLA